MSTEVKKKRKPTMKVGCDGKDKDEPSHRAVHDAVYFSASLDRLLIAMGSTLASPDVETFETFEAVDKESRSMREYLTSTDDGIRLLNVASLSLGRRVTAQHLIERYETVASRRAKIVELNAAPGIAQRTPEWYEARQGLITASDAAQALGCAKFGNQRSFFQKKCGAADEQEPFDGSIPPLKWGVMYEPVAQALYSALNGTLKIHEYGLLRHPTLPFIGASPDGISDAGVMLEIKCPWKRRLVEAEVPMQYYYQIQAQLAVCELDECDYFECEFFEVASPDDPDWSESSDGTGPLPDYARGLVLEWTSDETGAFTYDYFPRAIEGGTRQEIERWATSTIEAKGFQESPVFHWWVLRKAQTTRVTYDPEFANDMFDRLAVVWDHVLRYRTDRALYLADVGAKTFPTIGSKSAVSTIERSVKSASVIPTPFMFVNDDGSPAS